MRIRVPSHHFFLQHLCQIGDWCRRGGLSERSGQCWPGREGGASGATLNGRRLSQCGLRAFEGTYRSSERRMDCACMHGFFLCVCALVRACVGAREGNSLGNMRACVLIMLRLRQFQHIYSYVTLTLFSDCQNGGDFGITASNIEVQVTLLLNVHCLFSLSF